MNIARIYLGMGKMISCATSVIQLYKQNNVGVFELV